MSELPEGWVLCQLQECLSILDAKRKPINNKERNKRIEGKDINNLFPYFGATGQVGYIDGFLFDEELVALGEDGVPFFDTYKNKAYMLNGKTWVNNHAHVLKGINGINNQYICHYLNQFDYHGYVNGATRLKLTQANMRKIPISLAPLNEQIRIANKLDSLLGKLEATQKRLDKIPTLLKRFRQSVLAAAVSGELITITEVETLTLGDVATIQTGSTPLKSNSKYYENGNIPWLTSTVTGQQFVSKADKFVTKLAVKECRLKIFPKGALLVAMYGEGKTRGQVTEIAIEATINQACAAVIVNEGIASKAYIKICIENNYEQTRLMAEGGAQPNLNLTKVRSIPVTLPNQAEQKQIVKRVEALFKLADKVEQQYQSAKQSTDKLTQSILAKAFRGELVPQDPNDEPASELLKRIQAIKLENISNTPKKRIVGSSLKNKMRKSKVIISVIKALKEADKSLTGQELFSAAGYPNDADTKLVEKYFLDLRDQLENQSILKTRDALLNQDVFELAASI